MNASKHRSYGLFCSNPTLKGGEKTMRKTLIGISAMAMLLWVSSMALAGDYHYGTTLICSDCHVMHYSYQHDYNGGPAPDLGVGGPFEFLLKFEENELCLSCHDGQSFVPDVLKDNSSTTPIRLAGALNEVGSGTPYEDWKGHTLYSTATAPGETFSDPEGLTCMDCHYPHGSRGGINTYRNFSRAPGGVSDYRYVTYAVGTNDLTVDLFERGTAAGSHYDMSNVDFNEPYPDSSRYANWCKGCHTVFHGAVGGSEIGGSGSPPEGFVRHPAATANIGALGGGHSSLSTFRNNLNRVKVMSSTGDWGTQGQTWPTAPSDLTATCSSCHKGHGNQNAFGLYYMTGTGTWTEQGDGGTQAKGLCKQCHVQG